MTTWTNWAGNQLADPAVVALPATADDVAALVRSARRVKAIGAGHSFTDIGVTDGTLLKLNRMARIVGHDPATHRVRVQAGISLHELNRELLALGLALPNLGDVDPQSVAGAAATGTHGTGGRKQGVAAAIVGVQLVTATGDIVDIDEQHPWFNAARVGLGALGIVTEVTLQCVPAFYLHAREEPMPLPEVLDRLDEFVDGNDHFEFYWFPHTEKALVKRNNIPPEGTERTPLPPWRFWLDDEFLSNTVYERVQRLARRRPALIPRINALSGSLLGAREYTDHSFEVFASPRRVRFRESEFAMPRAAARDVIAELQTWFAGGHENISFPIEVRFTAADDVWLSTGFERDNVYVAVHQFHRVDPARYFAAAQAIFTAHEGRPHWGKLHTLDAQYLSTVYPRFADFVAIRDEADPTRRFSNGYLDRVLG